MKKNKPININEHKVPKILCPSDSKSFVIYSDT